MFLGTVRSTFLILVHNPEVCYYDICWGPFRMGRFEPGQDWKVAALRT